MLACTAVALLLLAPSAPCAASPLHLQPEAPSRAVRSGGGDEFRSGSAALLRVALDLMDDDQASAEEEYDYGQQPQQQRTRPSTQIQVLTQHVRDVAAALYLPLDWLVSHREDPTSHPLHRPLQAAWTMLSMKVTDDSTTSDAEEEEQQGHGAGQHATQHFSALNLQLADEAPTQYIRFLKSSYVSDPSPPLGSEMTVAVRCVGCAVADSAVVTFLAIAGTGTTAAESGVDFTLISSSPLSFPYFAPSLVGPAPARKRTTVLEGHIQLQALARTAQPFASVAARIESMLTRSFALQIANGVTTAGTAITVQQLDGTTYGTSASADVKIRSAYLPSVCFNAPTTIVNDLASYALFSVSCINCGLVDVNLVVRTNTTDSSYPGVSGLAFRDLYGIGEQWPWVAVETTLGFTADVTTNPLPRVQPDLSEAGWTARGDANITVAWLDSTSLDQPNLVQTIHFAVRLTPARNWQLVRTLQWEFVVQSISDVEAGVVATSGVSVATIQNGATMQAVPIVVLDRPAASQYSSGVLRIDPTIFCTVSGKIANATRTLYTCLTTADNSAYAQTQAQYLEFTTGSLLDVFQDETDVQLDASITSTITCAETWSWFNQSDNTFFQNAVGSGQNVSTQEQLLFGACAVVIANATTANTWNTTLTQYCQLFTRCYTRDHICHSFVDVHQFCICPYDRTGDNCQTFQAYQCDVRMVYPAMDVQTYTDSSSKSVSYSCPQPSSYHARLPVTVDNPGSNSKATSRPITSLQSKYGYLPHLDGDTPCFEYPSTSSNPSVSNPHAQTNPLGAQEFRYAVDCSFTPDNDLGGTLTTTVTPTVAPTWARIKQTPSDAVLAVLTAGNYTWDKDYDNFDGGWSYDATRIESDGSVRFAVSLLAQNPLQLRVHAQNFIRLSDNSLDQLSLTANAGVLSGPPSTILVTTATSTGAASLLASSTLGVTLNVSTLPEAYYKGGRYYLEANFHTYTAPDLDRRQTTATFPRGLVGNRFPSRLIVEQSTYSLKSPTADSKLSIVGILIIVIVCVCVAAALYKYYEHRREDEFQRVVKRQKARTKRREAEVEQARFLRDQARAQEAKNQL